MTEFARYQTPITVAQPRLFALELRRFQTPVAMPTTPPVFGAFSPGPGAVSRTDAIQVSVTESDDFAKIFVWAIQGDGTTVMIYNNATFAADFAAGSSIVGTTTRTITIQRNAPGWTADYTLYAFASDVYGNSAEASAAYTLTDPPSPGTTPPTVTLIAPADTSRIRRSSTTPIVVEVTDLDEGVAAVFVWVEYDQGRTEVVRGAQGFVSFFAGSSVETITNGLRFSIRRSGGWPSATVRLHFDPVDRAGNTG